MADFATRQSIDMSSLPQINIQHVVVDSGRILVYQDGIIHGFVGNYSGSSLQSVYGTIETFAVFNGELVEEDFFYGIQDLNLDARTFFSGYVSGAAIEPFFENYFFAGDDLLLTSTGGSTLLSYGGDDTITVGGQGSPTVIYSGDGDDLVATFLGNDTIYGGTGHDSVYGGEGNDLLYGAEGDDSLLGAIGNDVLYGEDGDDTLNAADGADSVFGGDGDDSVVAEDGADTLYGDDGNDSMSSGHGNDRLFGGAGDDWMHAGHDQDVLYGGAGLDTVRGWNGNDTLYGGDGDDSMSGGADSDLVFGGAGNDTLFAGGSPDLTQYGGVEGNNTLMGGAGHDTLIGGDANDILIGDGDASFDEASGSIYRLYRAFLGREPDGAGLIAWSNRVADGQSLVDVAQSFVDSTEFAQSYGQLDDAQFISLLYRNVLERDADTAGLSGWQAQLDNGQSRAQVVLGFSQSAEFQTNTSEQASTFGRDRLKSDATDDVFRLYQATLGRLPDLVGLEGWADRLAGGTDYGQVVDGFVTSTEFQQTYGALDDTAFVTLLYGNVLQRAPDTAGLSGWVGRLAAGADRASVVEGFAQSSEFRVSTEQALANSLRITATTYSELTAAADDLLVGGAGSDRMDGGFGSDVFLFAQGDGQAGITDTIVGLEAWDTIALLGYGFAEGDADTAFTHFTQTDTGVQFSYDGTTINLLGADLTWMDPAMLYVSDTEPSSYV